MPARHLLPLFARILAPALCAASALGAAAPADRAPFPGSIREVAAAAAGAGAPAVSRAALRPDEASAPIAFEVALRMRNFGELQQRIARGEQIARSEMAEKYFPIAADHDRLVQWLRDQGLEILRTDENRVAVFARGPVSAVSRALGSTFARVTGRDGQEYTSAITAPSLPRELSASVLGIHGLQQHIRPRPLAVPRRANAGQTISLGGYMPSQIAQAYNANALSATGSGQTIAIYALAYPQNADLTAFWKNTGVTQSTSNIQHVDVAGGPASSPSNQLAEEATLDTEWAGALAPGATVRIYAASEADPGENDEILQQVYADLPSQPSLHQLCICIGGDEAEVEKDYLIIEAQYMANLASGGVSVLVASGDYGAYSDPSRGTLLQVTYPTSDPDVTGVGGTTLVMSGSTVTSEVAWNDSEGSSGGGVSIVFGRPPWQTGTGVPAGVMRLVPDVAAAADPENGAYVYFQGAETTVGGTSWAAPIWTAFCALLNQGRGTPLGLLNPRIYPLNGTGAFRDITSGDNGHYMAGPGYDMCTGIGVPDMAVLSTSSLSATASVNIPAQLGNVFTTVGQPATFFVVAEGASGYSYSWQHLPFGSSTWEAVSDDAAYSGSGTAALVILGATASMSGDDYKCTVTAGSQSATSTPPASLTVSPDGVTTVAGWPGSAGSADGAGRAARFAYPGSVRADSAGNIYVADSYNSTVRKVAPGGSVTTVGGIAGKSGSTNGPVASALLNETAGVAVDGSGDLFVADNGNYEIREISASGTVTTLAGSAGVQAVVDGAGAAARFFDPQNLAIDAAGNLYVADGKGNVIRKVTPAGQVSTLAGNGVSGGAGPAGSADGTGPAAEFNDPSGIAVDIRGNVYVADTGNDTIRRIDPGGVVTTLAGSPGASGSADGTGSAARFSGPAGVGVDAVGNVYVADTGNSTIRMVTAQGAVTTIAGLAGKQDSVDGLAAASRLGGPGDVTIDNTGAIYVADSQNMTIRRIVPGASATLGIATQPSGAEVNLGSTAVLAVGPTGYAPFSFQWYLNGGAIIGANGPSYTLAGVQTSAAGSYTVEVSNASGSVMSDPAVLTVDVPPGDPQIAAQPQGATLAAGTSAGLSVSVSGPGPLSYQWFENGAPIAGATSPSYAATAIGSYTVAVTNPNATVVSEPAVIASGSRLINISTRAFVGTGGAITIAGIYIDGPASEYKQLVIRGVGPALSQFGVAGTLAATTVSVHDSAGNVIAANTGWGNAPVAGGSTAKAAFKQATATSMGAVGAFALPAGSADSALVADLQPGNYTVEMAGAGGATGVGLVEIYESNTSDPAVLTNISTRAEVGSGSGVLIAGFVVAGTQPATVLVRGIGPALNGPPFNVPGTLAQPVVSVYDGSSVLIASDQGWGNGPVAGTSSVAATFRKAAPADFGSVGAFSLVAGSLDSALVLVLPPGSYSAQIASADGTQGVALAEVYQIEP